MIAIEEAITDGHSISNRSAFSTPPKFRRARPISDQPAGQERPKASCDDEDSNGRQLIHVHPQSDTELNSSCSVHLGRADEGVCLAHQPT